MAISKVPEGADFLGIKNAVLITSTVYALTEEAQSELIKELPKNGYKIETKDGETHANLEVEHKCSCYHCNHIQSSRGVLTHNKPCISCNKPLYVEFNKGETIEFYFVSLARTDKTKITLKIYGYDDDKNQVLVYPEPIQNNRSFFATPTNKQLKSMEDNKNRYSRRKVIDHGKEIEVLAIPFSHVIDENSVINTSEITGEKQYFQRVTVHNGIAYGMFDDLPFPTYINISTEYINKKISLEEENAHEIIMHAAGQVSRVDFYHQDGRKAFFDTEISRMSAFVKNCVAVDYKEWEKFIRTAPMDGPNFIRSLAKWCATQSNGSVRQVKEEPNMWIALNAAAKQKIEGRLSLQEAVAAQDGLFHLAEKFGVVIRDGEQNPNDILGDVLAILGPQDTITKPINLEDGPT